MSELDKAAADLGADITGNEYGRITSGVAKAYKVQALMLAASPLWNDNADYADFKNKDGGTLTSTTFDKAKWTRAATAAKSSEYLCTKPVQPVHRNWCACLHSSLQCLPPGKLPTEWNQEWIYARSNSGSYMRYDRTPFHAGLPANQHGAGANGATQAMVDAYFMANGRPISDAASGYVQAVSPASKLLLTHTARNTFNQWTNREPRFYVKYYLQ